MRAVLGCVAVLAMAFAFTGNTGRAADDKIDPAKIVGKWTPVNAKTKATTEFTKDGKILLVIDAKGKEIKAEGMYKLEGTKLTITYKVGDKDSTSESVVKKLTDDELVFETPKLKKTDTLKRVK